MHRPRSGTAGWHYSVMRLDRSVLFRLATSTRFEEAVRAFPGGENAAWGAASRYVAGTTDSAALEQARALGLRGVATSIDLFGEQVRDPMVAERVAGEYERLVARVDQAREDVWLSVDLSHLGIDVDPHACATRLGRLAAGLHDGRRVQVGAEDHDRGDAVLSCIEAVAGLGLADRLGATLQANLRRAPEDLERLVDAGVHVRLVKGAYVESPQRALPYGEATDISYLRLAHRLAERGGVFALATHDAVLREAVLAALGPRPVEQLFGVRRNQLDELVVRGVPVRVYVPFGDDWFRYWMRRLAESRGA
jgi:proline dehydrogenase